MGPGPSNPYPEVMQALARPMLGHLDPEFLALLDETCDRLRQVFRTDNPLTLPISGTGSAGMEAAFVNVVEPRDVVVVGVNGVFGERMCDVAARCGADVVRVEAEWGQPIDPARLAEAHPAPKVVAVLHAGLGVVLDEGLEASWARHAACGAALHEGLEKLGFTLFAADGHRLPELTTAWVPDLPRGLDEPSARRALLDRFGIEIGGGL